MWAFTHKNPESCLSVAKAMEDDQHLLIFFAQPWQMEMDNLIFYNKTQPIFHFNCLFAGIPSGRWGEHLTCFFRSDKDRSGHKYILILLKRCLQFESQVRPLSSFVCIHFTHFFVCSKKNPFYIEWYLAIPKNVVSICQNFDLYNHVPEDSMKFSFNARSFEKLYLNTLGLFRNDSSVDLPSTADLKPAFCFQQYVPETKDLLCDVLLAVYVASEWIQFVILNKWVTDTQSM